MHSTKSNPHRNLELRLIFNKSKQTEEDFGRQKNKGYTAQHPLLKYVSHKNKETSYTTQIERLENLYEKIRKSTSKAKARKSVITATSTQKKQRELSISLKKNQIKIDSHFQKSSKIEDVDEKDTVKTIKKNSGEREKEIS